jgi:hypothetical protein
MNRESITIVSGLPRSGTSMMMRMLETGGMPVLIDNLRVADADNPRGYYEFEPVKQIARDRSWLPGARGKAVKIISELLKHLPPDDKYRVIFMRRRLEEVFASQREMLTRRGKSADNGSDVRMVELFRQHLARVDAWLKKQSNIEFLYVDYHTIIANPAEQAQKINHFLDNTLAVKAMAGVVDLSLYRHRCL